MLDRLRSFSRTWIAKILIAVLVVSFAAFGIENVITGLSANVVARVGNEEITARQFDRAYQDQMNFAAQQLGQMPTQEMAVQLGIPSQVISRLAAEASIDSLARGLGVGVSDQRLGRMLRADPTFGGTLGQFDPTNFQRVLQQYGMSESEYFEIQRKAARREQVVSSLLGEAVTPNTANELLDRYSGDTRTVDYFLVSEQSVMTVDEPTEADLQAYYDEHKATYRTVERRRADVLVLTNDALAATIDIPGDAIAAEYERTRAQLVRPERRTIQQAILADDAAAEAVEAASAAGKSFEDLRTELNLSPTDLGTLGQSAISDRVLAEAAFSLESGGYTVIQGIGSKRVIHVSAIEGGSTPTFEEAFNDIRRRLATSAARNQYTDILDQIEELHAAGQTVAQIADRFGLAYMAATTTVDGMELSQVPDQNRRQVAQAIFSAREGALAPTITIGSNNHVWFDLLSIEPARDQTPDEVRDRIVAGWTAQKTREAMTEMVEKALEELKAGTPIADVALGLNQFSVLSQPMTRNGDGTTLFPPQVASAIFAGGEGHTGSAINGDGDHLVFQVAEIAQAAPGSSSQQSRDYVQAATRDTLFGEFTNALRDDAGLRINQQTLNQIINPQVVGN